MTAIAHRVYTAAQVRELDRVAIQEQGIPGYTLMTRAGQATFNALNERWPDTKSLCVVCGGGNNGGDGYVVARLATAAGIGVTLLAIEGSKPLPEEAQAAREAWLNAGGVIHAADIVWPDDVDLIIDGGFGGNKASTVINLVNDEPEIVRVGCGDPTPFMVEA